MAAGRPKETFTPREVDFILDAARRGISKTAIAAIAGITRATLNEHFCTEIEKARYEGRKLIIDELWHRSKMSDRILIHLADRMLGPVATKIKITKDQAIQVLKDELNAGGISDSGTISEGEEDESITPF